jgi:uncharacterized protein (TIGR02453 family)
VERNLRVKAGPFDTAGALRWLRKLKKNNDRAWYAENSAEYNEKIKPAWEDLIATLIVAAIPIDARYAYVDPRACLFRLARDIRFSKDKTPFKTGVSAWISPFGKHGSNPGFYVRIEPGNNVFSAGIYVPERPVLDGMRERIADDATPFARILAAKKMQPYMPLRTDPLVRVPRGYPKDHPRAEWIRARNYLVRRTFGDAEIAKNGAFATFRSAMRDVAPFVRYLEEVKTAAALRRAQGDRERADPDWNPSDADFD